MHVHRPALTAACLTAAAALVLSACSSASEGAEPTETPSPTAVSSAADPTASATPTTSEVAVPAGLVGPGCAGYIEKVPVGPGSVEGMGRDPVAAAMANSRVLTTLTGALSGKLNPDVNLVDALNTGQFTVFAPTDEAFGKVDPTSIEKFKTDSDLLTAVLKYHLVPGESDPAQLVGDHKTLQGGSLTVSGAGSDLKVNGATVVCGGIKAANATVYLIDTVLMPPPPPAPAPPGGPVTTSATATPTP